jgi:hypothetical protein
METYERYKEAMDNWEFHGTEHYYRLDPASPTVITDGVKWFADNFECYWLLTLINCVRAKLKDQTFIVVDIKSWRIGTDHNVADIKFTDGNDNKVYSDIHVNMTDLPEGNYSLWIANYPGEYPGNKVIYLSTEH